MNTLLYLTSFIFLFQPINYSLNEVEGFSNLDKRSKTEVFYESDTLIISAVTDVCEVNGRDQSFKFLTFRNKTTNPISFSFERHVYRNGDCSTCDNNNASEYTFQVDLEASEELKGTCNNVQNKTLRVFNYFVKRVPGMSNSLVTDIKFENLTFNN